MLYRVPHVESSAGLQPMTSKIIPVVMCGGAGTRLWPVSRDTMPKQFIPLLGQDSTFQRVMKLLSNDKVFTPAIVITNVEYRFTVQEQLQACGVAAQIVLEPMRRDSAAAVAAATELALARDPDAIVGVFAADHIVQDGNLFVETCRQAGIVAEQGRIVTIGIPPTSPATGYGYIQPGEDIADGARSIAAFVEKPDGKRAAQYLLDGYLWN
ncbi:MAG: mannose-1-phosphate guanylyltransferase/mannose-6-phosphate isomerase, partial [Comamonadaceae bacterium]